MKNTILRLPPTGINHTYKRGRYGNVYRDERITCWENECLWKLKKVEKVEPNQAGSLCVNMAFYFDNKRKNDIDGRIKVVLDLLERSGAYANDSLITDLIVAKRYDKEKPRLEVEVYS